MNPVSSVWGSTPLGHAKQTYPTSTGKIIFLHVDLADLAGVKRRAEQFMSEEKRLDMLWNNRM